MNAKTQQGGEVIIYKSKEGREKLEVRLHEENVWLSLNQIATLFGSDKSNISRHIKNIYEDGELTPNSTIAKITTVQKEGKRKVTREIDYYNLDLILSIGYRVNSKWATQFRIWATSILKDHILKGYTLKQKRLQEKGLSEFEEAVGLIKRTLQTRLLNDTESKGLLEVITNYASTWILLQKYDQSAITSPKTRKTKKKFDYAYCKQAIEQLKIELMKKKLLIFFNI